MERMKSCARPMGMTKQSQIRGLTAAGLLCMALAGCGTAAATTTPAGAQNGAPEATPTTAPEVGCASVNEATKVTIIRQLLVAEPLDGGGRTLTQRNTTLVRALFRDFCAAVSHPYHSRGPMFCPIDVGISYTGTFYDGKRVLATFVYGASGCQRIAVTAAGHTRSTFLLGRAASAAPHLKADFAAVLGQSELHVYPEPQLYGTLAQIGHPVSGTRDGRSPGISAERVSIRLQAGRADRQTSRPIADGGGRD